MGSIYGNNIRVSIFGQSHSRAVGVTVEGLPAGFRIDMERLRAFLDRRAPGRGALSSPRTEQDRPEFLSGISEGMTCGAPLTAIIINEDARRADYDAFRDIPRPGHADMTARAKYGTAADISGGGHLSGRLTAPLCVAGGIALQMLESVGISVISRIKSIAGEEDTSELSASTAGCDFPAADPKAAERMKAAIAAAAAEGDSVGGVVECKVLGLPAGLGDPMFDGMENRIAQAVFGIPSAKGIEFGAGFASAAMKGSECNDAFRLCGGRVTTDTNNCGGLLGGITDGMPVEFRVAFKPVPSIAKEQKSVDMRAMREASISFAGRSDACAVPRAVPCVEAAAAIAVLDALIEQKKYGAFLRTRRA